MYVYIKIMFVSLLKNKLSCPSNLNKSRWLIYKLSFLRNIDYCVMYCVLTALICEVKKIAFINLSIIILTTIKFVFTQL